LMAVSTSELDGFRQRYGDLWGEFQTRPRPEIQLIVYRKHDALVRRVRDWEVVNARMWDRSLESFEAEHPGA
jgi:hypothetical protein